MLIHGDPVADQIYHVDGRFSLQWRTLPPADQVIMLLQVFLTGIDDTGYVDWQPADSRSKKAVRLADIGHGIEERYAVVAYKHTVRKYVQQDPTFFAHLTFLIEQLLQHIGIGDLSKFRHSFYASMSFLKADQLHRMVNSLAVTIGIHPTSLGVEAEEDGKIWINSDSKIKIRCHIAENIYRVAAAKEAAEKKYNGPNKVVHITSKIHKACRVESIVSEQDIPSKVYELAVHGNPAVVVIVEHQNVALAYQWLGINAMRAIIIMTQGMASMSCREFICLLRNQLKDIPFVCFTDHDMHGGLQFSILTFGSKRAAWAAESMVCSDLQFCTPSKAELLAFQKENCPAAQWSKREKELQHRMTKNKLTRIERSIYKGLEDLGVLEHAPRLKEAMKIVEANQGKFSLALASYKVPRGMETLMMQKANRLANIPVTVQVPDVTMMSPSHVAFELQETQEQGSRQASTSNVPALPSRNALQNLAARLNMLDAS